jgi:DNA processing protein
MSDTKYWAALNAIPGIGSRRLRRLVKHFGSARSAFEASPKAWQESGLPADLINNLTLARERVDPEQIWASIERAGISVILTEEPQYPALLDNIYDPPVLLYCLGKMELLQQPCVALVGSRKATEYGKAVAAKMAKDLAKAQVTVVSGMARGIDTSVHQGALAAGGHTVAVLGCGPDICYPPENLSLRVKIVEKGLLISEFAPGTGPKPAFFPLRNRIISGLSLATVVVEAGEKSGALITADCALEQGRDVFAVPGSVNSPQSRGCHKLLKDGAFLAERAADILSVLGLGEIPGEGKQDVLPLSEPLTRVLSALEHEPVYFDDLLNRLGLTAKELAALLGELELSQWVKKMPGNYYLRV